MSHFDNTFGTSGKHVFLPVIHAESEDQVVRNMKVADGGGADGVFLINHHLSHHQLFSVYDFAREKFPAMWIGLNCLDLGWRAIGKMPHTVQGLWADNGGVTDLGVDTDFYHFHNLRKGSGWKGLYFGGVAFKGQAPVEDPAKAAKNAMPFTDVITTSGPRTGVAPLVSKIQAMRRAINGHPFAIASGINIHNVDQYMPFCDCFMVNSSIVYPDSEDFDPGRLQALARKLGK